MDELKGHQAKILFIDDERNVLDGLKRKLRSKSKIWDMFFTDNVGDAQKIYHEQPINVIVSDIKMPGKDGFDLFREIKEDQDGNNMEIIMMTGLQDDDIKQIALNLGAFDLLNKPIAENEIIEKIEQALESIGSRDNEFLPES